MALPEEAEKQLKSIVPLSWEQVRSQWHQQATPEERQFRDNLPNGYGKASPLHNLRLYSSENKESDVAVTFYRDSASWCPYCQKVWMALEYKRIPYRVERVNMRCYGDKTAEFMRIQPSGQIPVASINGKIYGQSNDILFSLDEAFPEAPGGSIAKFSTSMDKLRAQELLQLERQLFSTWMNWLTGSSRSKGQYVRVLEIVEQKLGETSSGGFFMGDKFSIVDIQFAPFLERMAASLLYFKGFIIRVPTKDYANIPYPNVNKWFDAMEKLEAYQVTKSDYYTHCWDLPPQLGGCTFEDEGQVFERAINGERSIDQTQGSWELPLQPHNGGIEPDWDFLSMDEASAKREAVERLTYNYQNIVKFAARGAGQKGMPPVSAPLSDPRATPSDVVLSSVDTVLKCVALAMLDNPDAEIQMRNVAATISSQGDEFSGAVVASIAYLRDRVGVPRDMRLPAARQFRAYLNWSLGYILT